MDGEKRNIRLTIDDSNGGDAPQLRPRGNDTDASSGLAAALADRNEAMRRLEEAQISEVETKYETALKRGHQVFDSVH